MVRFVALGAFALGCAGVNYVAVAGDYAHSCRSADGIYTMNDGGLSAAENERAGKPREIKYRVLETIVLFQRKGHCRVNHPDARGQTFGFESRTYVQRIAFRHNGQRVTTTMLCELAASGLPASFSCDREVVSYDYRIKAETPPDAPAPQGDSGLGRQQGQVPTRGTRWALGESTLRLIADGAGRTFVYEAPTDSGARRGISPGSALFKGERRGRAYVGEAYAYARGCRPEAYKVEGDVSNGDRRVTLVGYRPRLNAACRRIGYRRVELTLDLVR